MHLFRIIVVAGLTVFFAACGSRPTQVLTEAEQALVNAALAKKCAPDEYAAADRMFAKAQKLADEEEYDKAETTARAAQKLAKKAMAKAEARRDECLKPPEPKDSAADFVDDAGPGLDAMKSDSGGLQTVYFDYNVAELTDAGKEIMQGNAAWLRNNASVSVTVVGHCDVRGSTEYNLALGEKRAQTARNYLVEMGVDRSRMGVVSYGEEQPADYGESLDAHAQNRRAEFRVKP